MNANRIGSVRDTYAATVLVWVAGLVAGLLLRSTAGAHGLLASLVVVATSGAAGGFAYRTARERDRVAGAALHSLRASLEDRRLP